MTMEEFIDHAASWGISAVELTSYYFADSTPTYFASLKGRCTRLGLDVSGGAIGNNFCLRDPAKLRKEIDHVKRGTEAISLLGGKTLRIFAGSLEKGDTEDAARPRIVEAIQEACDHAAKLGVYLALENHGGITSTADQLLAIVKAVKHDWFGVNLDTGNFRTPDPYGDLVKNCALCRDGTDEDRGTPYRPAQRTREPTLPLRNPAVGAVRWLRRFGIRG